MSDPIQPWDMSGIVRDDEGVKHFVDLPASLVEMLHRSVEATPDAEALVELDGPRMTYRELWDRACCVEGGVG